MQIQSAKLTAILVGAGIFFSLGIHSKANAQQGLYPTGLSVTHHRVGPSKCQACEHENSGHFGFLSKIFRKGSGSHSSHHHGHNRGWGVVKHPVQRQSVVYRNYWPNKFYGQPGAFAGGHRYPMVYQPTDTTQLGFYYQHVPQWLPNRSMLPPAPNPAKWFSTNESDNHDYHGEVIYSQPQPATTPHTPPALPTPKPVLINKSAQEMPIFPRR